MEAKILVYIDQLNGNALPASWEALGVGFKLAQEMDGQVVVLTAGKQSMEVAQQAFAYGSQAVLYCDDLSVSDYRPEPLTTLIVKTAREYNVEVILFPTSTRGRELAAMSAIDLESGVLADVIALEFKEGQVWVTRPVYGGKLLVKAVCTGKPQIITTRARAFERPQKDPLISGSPVKVEAGQDRTGDLCRVVELIQSESQVNLVDAAVVVAGGRGVAISPHLQAPAGLDEKQQEIWRAQQGFKLVEELAEVLGGAVGASRAAVDAGYVPYSHQVGQTGKVVTPDLYIACGISGAIQHLAGMRTSKMIVAINKDADAPIFRLARFGVAGDLFAILPALTEALRRKLEN